jgi:hypothetical protein
MKAQLIKQNWSVLAQCPNCHDVRSFEMRYMPTAVAGVYVYKEKNYSRLLSVFSQCARCSHGGLASSREVLRKATREVSTVRRKSEHIVRTYEYFTSFIY